MADHFKMYHSWKCPECGSEEVDLRESKGGQVLECAGCGEFLGEREGEPTTKLKEKRLLPLEHLENEIKRLHLDIYKEASELLQEGWVGNDEVIELYPPEENNWRIRIYSDSVYWVNIPFEIQTPATFARALRHTFELKHTDLERKRHLAQDCKAIVGHFIEALQTNKEMEENE